MVKWYFVIVLSFIFAGTVSAQQNRHDEAGRKHGEWVKKDGQGHISYEGQFEHGVPVGEFRHYYPNERLKTVAHYSDSARVIRVKEYYKNGELKAEGKYVEKERDSTWMFYNDKGIRVKQEHYEQGTPRGTWKVYYGHTGAVSEETEYREGEKHGSWKQYFEDGELKLQGRFVNGKRQGEFRVYFPSGEIKRQGKYKDNLRDGIWIRKNREGDTIKKSRHKDGFEKVLMQKEIEEEELTEEEKREIERELKSGKNRPPENRERRF